MNGSHEFETGSSSAARVTATASGGSPQVGVQVLEPQRRRRDDCAAATASMPKPAMPSIRASAGHRVSGTRQQRYPNDAMRQVSPTRISSSVSRDGCSPAAEVRTSAVALFVR